MKLIGEINNLYLDKFIQVTAQNYDYGIKAWTNKSLLRYLCCFNHRAITIFVSIGQQKHYDPCERNYVDLALQRVRLTFSIHCSPR